MRAPLRVIFAGTPDFAARALDAIVAAGHEVPLVLTQPDRPAGRGRKLTASPVRVLGAKRRLDVHQPERLRTDEQQAPLLAVAADVMVVAAYGLILPRRVLDHPRHGCLNIHASLLPRWRGAAPIHRAILAGDHASGISIMQMDAGLDTGPVVSEHRLDIAPDETTGTLHDRLAVVGAEAIVAALDKLSRDGRLDSTPQPAEGATYAAKITADEARIDWSLDAATIARRVRAFDPAPGAFTTVDGAVLKIWRARPATAAPPASTTTSAGDGPMTSGPVMPMAAGRVALIEGTLVAGTGHGPLIIDFLQPAGSRRMSGAAWARGRPDLDRLALGT